MALNQAENQLQASIVITTRNRWADLRKALASCVKQTGIAYEIIVFDDASDEDETPTLQAEFPTVRFIRSTERLGYIVHRNRGFQEAKGAYVFSLDDDAWFESPETLQTTLQYIQEFPQARAFALKYVEPGSEPDQCHQLEHGSPIRSYIGCAHAICREIALELGGYREFFVHQGEERDLCLRIWDRGYEVRFLNTPSIVHCPSPKRDLNRWHSRGIRNTFLFEYLNTPLLLLPSRILASVILLFRHSQKTSGLAKTMTYFVQSLGDCFRYAPFRHPVSWRAYQQYRSLPSAGPSPQAGLRSGA